MSLEHVPGAILLSLICIVAALGLGLLGVRFHKPTMKRVAVMIGVMPVLGIAFNLSSSWFGWDHPAEFRTAYAGPASVEASVTRTAPFPVTNPDVQHELELTPEIRGGDAPTRAIRLRFRVRSPNGEVLAQGQQVLAPGQGLRWSPLRAAFQPHEWGQHSLELEMPNPIGTVNVVVRELR